MVRMRRQASVKRSDARASRGPPEHAAQRIALKLRAKCPRAQGVGAADKKVSQRGNAILPTRAPVSFKRLLGSGLVGKEIPEAIATDGGITVEREPKVARPVTSKGLAIPHANEHG